METESKIISEQEGVLCRDDDGWFKLFKKDAKPNKEKGIWWDTPTKDYSLLRLMEMEKVFPDIDALIPPGEGPLGVVFKLEMR